ncbi:hypothetical protein HDV05_003790 [Chytridiales sp. JEL 0842]|nr:hypothetical protein HDV05_003790 [Chytridiales sp. JEL 0842]
MGPDHPLYNLHIKETAGEGGVVGARDPSVLKRKLGDEGKEVSRKDTKGKRSVLQQPHSPKPSSSVHQNRTSLSKLYKSFKKRRRLNSHSGSRRAYLDSDSADSDSSFEISSDDDNVARTFDTKMIVLSESDVEYKKKSKKKRKDKEKKKRRHKKKSSGKKRREDDSTSSTASSESEAGSDTDSSAEVDQLEWNESLARAAARVVGGVGTSKVKVKAEGRLANQQKSKTEEQQQSKDGAVSSLSSSSTSSSSGTSSSDDSSGDDEEDDVNFDSTAAHQLAAKLSAAISKTPTPSSTSKNSKVRKHNIHDGSSAPGSSSKRVGFWSEEETQRLVNAVKKYGTHWGTVAKEVGGREAGQCEKRWKRLDSNVRGMEYVPQMVGGARKKVLAEAEGGGKDVGDSPLVGDGVVGSSGGGGVKPQTAPSVSGIPLGASSGSSSSSSSTSSSSSSSSSSSGSSSSSDSESEVDTTEAKKVLSLLSKNILSGQPVSAVQSQSPQARARPWSKEEDRNLLRAVRIHGNRWERVERVVPGRNKRQCKDHWNRVLSRKPIAANVNAQNVALQNAASALNGGLDYQVLAEEGDDFRPYELPKSWATEGEGEGVAINATGQVAGEGGDGNDSSSSSSGSESSSDSEGEGN